MSDLQLHPGLRLIADSPLTSLDIAGAVPGFIRVEGTRE
jgi:hypothetical protein